MSEIEQGAVVSSTPNTGLEAAGESLGIRRGMWGIKGSGDTSGFGDQIEDVVVSVPSQRPFGSWFDEVVDIIIELAAADGYAEADVIEKVVVDRDQLVIFIKRERIVDVARYLRDDQDLRFEMCLGVSAVHYPHDTGRELHAYIPFFSITHNRMLSLEVAIPEADPHMPSLTSVYPGADWPEREAFDLMG
ncbi:MAG: NADH-quinone oxidoreductase subunit C, partial [Arcanobacterium sp.]|nr:NADH-quinone oxidoreductase subunit C [Arcanobacterium sp.]